MKTGIINADSQREKNQQIEEIVREAAPMHEVVNFGVGTGASGLNYVQAAVCAGLLLNSGAVDFIVTGCSSGQGMALACNSLPGVLCGFVQTPADAFLFGRINNGNAVAYPFGLEWGWCGEINFRETMKALFSEPFGQGYPKQDAERKMRDTQLLKDMNRLCKRTMAQVLPELDRQILSAVMSYSPCISYILENGTDKALVVLIEKFSHEFSRQNTTGAETAERSAL